MMEKGEQKHFSYHWGLVFSKALTDLDIRLIYVNVCSWGESREKKTVRKL